MKLISKFHDYYDTVLTQGRDESVVYVRTRSLDYPSLNDTVPPFAADNAQGRPVGVRSLRFRDTANKPEIRWAANRYLRSRYESDADWRFDEAFVVIAGRAYSVLLLPQSLAALSENASDKDPVMGAADVPAACVLLHDMKLEEFRVRGVPSFNEPVFEALEPKVGNSWFDTDRKADARRYDAAKEAFLAKDHTALNVEMGAPVLLLFSPSSISNDYMLSKEVQNKKSAVLLNPRLQSLGFQKTLDPYSCFQEISQFIGGVVPGRQMPMVDISDKSQVVKKGFDPVYGFRTRPKVAKN